MRNWTSSQFYSKSPLITHKINVKEIEHSYVYCLQNLKRSNFTDKNAIHLKRKYVKRKKKHIYFYFVLTRLHVFFVYKNINLFNQSFTTVQLTSSRMDVTIKMFENNCMQCCMTHKNINLNGNHPLRLLLMLLIFQNSFFVFK